MKLSSGPYKDRYAKDALFCELGKALLRSEQPNVDELLDRLDKVNVPQNQRPKRSTVSKWLPAWRNWYFGRCPADFAPYQCSSGGVKVPTHSQTDGEQLRGMILAKPDLIPTAVKQTKVKSLDLPDEEAAAPISSSDTEYDPQDDDDRKTIVRQIKERRGQQQFRDALRSRYGDCCAITGCDVLAVLEAAHIKPYRGDKDNHPTNGLLLRTDIHTLFDLDLIGINPSSLRVEIARQLAHDDLYSTLAGKVLHCTAVPPSSKALKCRYEQFRLRRKSVES